jgi:hypothetical protein
MSSVGFCERVSVSVTVLNGCIVVAMIMMAIVVICHDVS